MVFAEKPNQNGDGRMPHNKKGFTLIELMMVVIIVGILATISAPMMRGNMYKAKCSEAIAAIGSIRTAERTYYAEYNTYGAAGPGEFAAGNANLSSYIKPGDLNGRYFNDYCYLVNGTSISTYSICANLRNSTDSTVNSGEYDWLIMNQNGSIVWYKP